VGDLRTEIWHFVFALDHDVAMCGIHPPKLKTDEEGDVTCYRCLQALDHLRRGEAWQDTLREIRLSAGGSAAAMWRKANPLRTFRG
jgi:hypothetical protein